MKTYIEELKELKELLDSGILTQEEFDIQKNKILGKSDTVEVQETEVSETEIQETVEPKFFGKEQCAICYKKIGFVTRFKLKDGNYACAECIRKAGLTTSVAHQNYLKENVTVDTFFNTHNPQSEVQNQPKTPLTKASQEPATQRVAKGAIICPKCKSAHVSFMQQGKKGFSVGKAVGGSLLSFGTGVGALAGFAGKKGKKQWHCQNCGSVFETKK